MSKYGLIATAVVVVACMSGCASKRVTLFTFGSQKRSVAIDEFKNAASIDRQRMGKALTLFDNGDLSTARSLAMTLYDTQCDPEARELVAVIATKDGQDATEVFEKALSDHPQHVGLRKTLVWSLSTRGEHDRSVDEAMIAAKTLPHLDLWDFVSVAEQKRDVAQRWNWVKRIANWVKRIAMLAAATFLLICGAVAVSKIYESVSAQWRERKPPIRKCRPTKEMKSGGSLKW